MKSLKKFGKIGVLGHSEGGTIAFMMGANSGVDFLISMAGSAADGVEVIVGQNEAIMQLQGIPQYILKDYASALRLIYADRVEGKVVENESQYIDDLCKDNNLTLPDEFTANLEQCITAGGEWLSWFLKYNPADAISKITCPVMALNGTMDMQVLSEDNIPVIKENLPRNKKNLIKEYDALNHLFQHCTYATSMNYGAIEETMSENVLNDIVDWIKTVK